MTQDESSTIHLFYVFLSKDLPISPQIKFLKSTPPWEQKS